MSSPLLFLHIPKAAGTTLRQVLERPFDRDEVLTLYGTDYADPGASAALWNALSEKRRARVRMIVGHFGYGLHGCLGAESDAEPGRPARYVTMLRHPFDRVVSNYRDMRDNPRVPLYRELQHTSFEQYLERGLWHDADNGQVRRLSGLEAGGLHLPFGEVTREMLAAAQGALERDFEAVLLTEEFDRSLLLLSRLFHWEDVSYVTQNAGTRRAEVELTPRAQALLERHNELDVELHEYARRRLSKDFKSAGLTEAALARWRGAKRTLSPLGRVFALGRTRLRRLRRALRA